MPRPALPLLVAVVVVLGTAVAGCDSGSSSSAAKPSSTTAPACSGPRYAAVQGGSADAGTVVLVGGGAPRPVTTTGRSGQPSFSPDGTQLAYGAAVSGSTAADLYLAVRPVAGGDPRTLAAPEASGPAWSPDGRSVAYVRNQPEQASGEIRVVTVASGADDRAGARMAGDLRLASPTWSPDGISVYYLATSGDLGKKGQIQAWAAQPLSGSFEEISVVDDSVVRMVLGPDGRTALLSGTGGDLWTLNVKTGAARALTGTAMLATWIDATHVVGYVRQGNAYRLGTFALQGTRLTRTGTVPGFSTPSVQPWYGVDVRPCNAT